jgi:hypothetical protein
MQKVAAIPEVKMAGLSTNRIPPDNGWSNQFELLGLPSAKDQSTSVNWVSKEYFPVLQIPLLRGRIWDEAETERGARVAVINETMARRFFAAGDALGHQIRMPNMKPVLRIAVALPESTDWFEIVGVVGDALNDGLDKAVVCRRLRRSWSGPRCRRCLFSTAFDVRSSWSTPTSRSEGMYEAWRNGSRLSRSGPSNILWQCCSEHSRLWLCH